MDDDMRETDSLERLRLVHRERAARRTWIGCLIAGIGLVAVVLSLIWWGISSSQQMTDRDGRIMNACITSGGQWISGNCVKGNVNGR